MTPKRQDRMLEDGVVLRLTTHQSANQALVVLGRTGHGLMADACCENHGLVAPHYLVQPYPTLVQDGHRFGQSLCLLNTGLSSPPSAHEPSVQRCEWKQNLTAEFAGTAESSASLCPVRVCAVFSESVLEVDPRFVSGTVVRHRAGSLRASARW